MRHSISNYSNEASSELNEKSEPLWSSFSSDLSMFEMPQQVSFVSLYDTINTSTTDLLIYFEQLWNRTELLHACLSDPSEDRRPSSSLRPALFYLGHPITVVFHKLSKKKLLMEKIKYEQLSRTDIFRWLELDDGKSMEEQKETVTHTGWQPCVSSIVEIRRTALLAMRDAIANSKLYTHINEETKLCSCEPRYEKEQQTPPSSLLSPVSPEWAILMSIEHAHLTLETYVRFIRHLPLSAIDVTAVSGLWSHWRRAPFRSQLEHIPKNRLIQLRGGVVSWLGLRVEVAKQATDIHQAIDEEEMQRTQLRADARRTCRQGGSRGVVQVSPYQAAKCKVSNGEFFEFIEAGGYSTEHFWSAKGWAWRNSGNISHPNWWYVVEGKSYFFRDTLEEIPMPWDWPVEVTLWEAEAFIAWKNAGREDSQHAVYALPTEAQHALFNGVVPVVEPVFEQAVHHGCSQGWRCPMSNLDWKYHSASPVDALPPSICGIHDPAGNFWEWVIDDAPPSTDPDTAPTTEQGSHALVGGCWTSSGDPATSARYNAGGSCPGRGTLLQHASFRYVLNSSG